MKTAALDSIVYGRNIKYKVNFPSQHILPKLTKILYNNRLICSGPPESGYVTTIKLEHTLRTQSSGLLGYQVSPQYQGITNQPGSVYFINDKESTTQSGVSNLEIIIHPNGEVSVRPSMTTMTTKKPELQGFSDRYEQYSVTEKPVDLTSRIESTTRRMTTSINFSSSTVTRTSTTSTTVKPMKPENLDSLLEELYGSNSEFVHNPTTSTTTTPKTTSTTKR